MHQQYLATCHHYLILSKEAETRMRVKLLDIVVLMMTILSLCLQKSFACNDDDDCKFIFTRCFIFIVLKTIHLSYKLMGIPKTKISIQSNLLIFFVSTAFFPRRIGFNTPSKDYCLIQYVDEMDCSDYVPQCRGESLHCRKVKRSIL